MGVEIGVLHVFSNGFLDSADGEPRGEAQEEEEEEEHDEEEEGDDEEEEATTQGEMETTT